MVHACVRGRTDRAVRVTLYCGMGSLQVQTSKRGAPRAVEMAGSAKLLLATMPDADRRR